jgi:proteasome lid subunit RPN8/RPN11
MQTVLLCREALSQLGVLRASLVDVNARSSSEQQGVGAARAIRAALPGLTTLANEVRTHHQPTADLLRDAAARLIVSEARAEEKEVPAGARRRIRIGSDLLYHFCLTAMPVEKMLVVAGRVSGPDVIIGASFEVTGTGSVAHCRADPDRLAQALVSMSNSGCHMAMWIHSHPGLGPGGTYPSSIDTGQHSDWIRDYSSDLVSGIVVEDGWIRLWGTALEHDDVDVAIEGDGVHVTRDGRHLLLHLAE